MINNFIHNATDSGHSNLIYNIFLTLGFVAVIVYTVIQCKHYGIGRIKALLFSFCVYLFSANVSLGDRSGIGIGAKIYGTCIIGDDVMMGSDVTIITREHRTERTDIPMREQGFEDEHPVVIGNDVWLGDRVTILPGVTIGDGCIVGAGAVVTGDIPPYSVAVGVPARVIRMRERANTH